MNYNILQQCFRLFTIPIVSCGPLENQKADAQSIKCTDLLFPHYHPDHLSSGVHWVSTIVSALILLESARVITTTHIQLWRKARVITTTHIAAITAHQAEHTEA